MKKFVLIMIAMAFLVSPAFANDDPAGPIWYEYFPDGLVDANEKPYMVENLEGKLFGLYFSASWCRGCAAFSRILVPFRNKHKEAFEVVLMGFDYSKPEMHSYMEKYNMPWAAVPYDSPARIALKKKFNVSDIPFMIVLTQDGKVVSKDAVYEVEAMEDNAINHWLELAEK